MLRQQALGRLGSHALAGPSCPAPSAGTYKWSRVLRVAASGSQPGEQQPWWDTLNKNNIRGPEPPAPQDEQGLGETYFGAKGFKRLVSINKSERQRVWDTMRSAARVRYEQGQMPAWFNPHWLTFEEAPVNQILREMGGEEYQFDDTWIGRPFTNQHEEVPGTAQGGDDGSNNGGRGKDGRGKDWWREDDPYWMLRDWGDHPMRWWTLGFAAIMALGGVGSYLFHGSLESLFVGWGSGVWLALCSLAMSDMRTQWVGPLGVKMAWAACALIALKDGLSGWAHHAGRQDRYTDPAATAQIVPREAMPLAWLNPKLPTFHFTASGLSAVAMCVAYMVTGMSGLDQHCLPLTPGAVYKSSDVVLKQRVWQMWGYGRVTMRQ